MKIAAFFLCLFTQLFVSGQTSKRDLNRTVPIKRLEIPKTALKKVIINHTAYSLVYNEKHEQANWVAYVLTKEKTSNLFERSDKFLPDPKVCSGTANDQDYAGSGYDRGHLAPAADMGWSEITSSESFYYSNMSPQEPGFNRGIWKKTEELVRGWAAAYDTLYIVTGPVLKKGLKTIGKNKVSVPEYYYKVVLDYAGPEIKGIGFIMPNTASKSPLQSFAVSIDSIEKLTGIDFFPALPNDQESVIEKTLCIACWNWNPGKQHVEPEFSTEPAIKEEKTVSVQCSATTQAGNQCKRMTKSPNGRCSQHGGN